MVDYVRAFVVGERYHHRHQHLYITTTDIRTGDSAQ